MCAWCKSNDFTQIDADVVDSCQRRLITYCPFIFAPNDIFTAVVWICCEKFGPNHVNGVFFANSQMTLWTCWEIEWHKLIAVPLHNFVLKCKNVSKFYFMRYPLLCSVHKHDVLVLLCRQQYTMGHSTRTNLYSFRIRCTISSQTFPVYFLDVSEIIQSHQIHQTCWAGQVPVWKMTNIET